MRNLVNKKRLKFISILAGTVLLVAVFLFGGCASENDIDSNIDDSNIQGSQKEVESKSEEPESNTERCTSNKIIAKIEGQSMTPAQLEEWIKDNPDDQTAKKFGNFSCEEYEKNMANLEPSERALKAASHFYLNLSSENQQDLLSQFGGDSKSIQVAIRNYALMLDDNLEQLILIETIKEQNNSAHSVQGSAGGSLESAQSLNDSSPLDEYKQRQKEKCQKDLNEYNVCMNEYNAKMADYNSCLAENADPDKRFKSYCSKPFSFCHKPYCAY